VVCGISCIRPWAPFNGTAFPMPYEGGLFECLRSGPVTQHPSGASSKPLLQAVPGRELGRSRCFNTLVGRCHRYPSFGPFAKDNLCDAVEARKRLAARTDPSALIL